MISINSGISSTKFCLKEHCQNAVLTSDISVKLRKLILETPDMTVSTPVGVMAT